MGVPRVAVVVLALVVAANAISFEVLPNNRRKCLQEDVHKNVLMVGEYQITDGPSPVLVEVRLSSGECGA